MKPCSFLVGLFLAFILESPHLGADDRLVQPDSVQLFHIIHDSPDIAYEGHMMITQWTGTVARAEEANIYFKPPHDYRVEFLLPDGSVDRVVMSNGFREKVQLMQSGSIVKEYSNKQPPRLLDNKQENELLSANYK